MHRGFKKGCGINSNILTSPSLADGKGLPPSSASPPPSPPLSRSSLAPGDQEEEQEGVACSSITILHFNDVYNIEGREKEPVGGAARFKTCLDRFWHLDPLTFFSGDALAPSNSKLNVAWCVPLDKQVCPCEYYCIFFWTLLSLHVMVCLQSVW